MNSATVVKQYLWRPIVSALEGLPTKAAVFPVMVRVDEREWVNSLGHLHGPEECSRSKSASICEIISKWSFMKYLNKDIAILMNSSNSEFVDVHVKIETTDVTSPLRNISLCAIRLAIFPNCLFCIVSDHPDGIYNRIAKVYGGYSIEDSKHECIFCGQRTSAERILCPLDVSQEIEYFVVDEGGNVLRC